MEKLTKIKSRLLDFAKKEGLTKEKFYSEIGIDGANFRGKNAESDLGSEKIVNILRAFPQLSPDWLLLGNGEMLRDFAPKNVAMATAPHAHAANGDMKVETPAELLALIASQQETISRQARIIEQLTLNK